jgi:hypothetical protein
MYHVVSRAVGARAVSLFGSGFTKMMHTRILFCSNNGWGSGRYKKLWIQNKICRELPIWVMEVTTLLLVYAGKFPLICRKLSEKCSI